MNFRIGAATAVAALACLVHCGDKPNAAGGAPPPTAVRMAFVEQRPIRTTSEYVAQLKSRKSVDVQPQIDGHITKIYVHPGDHVKAGTALMQIDPTKQAQAVVGAEATRNSKLAALRLAEQQKARADGLFKAGVLSKQDLDQAVSTLDAAKADLGSVDAQIAGEKVQLRYYEIAASDNGIVGDIPVRIGDYVTPSTRLTTIDQNSALEAYLSVPIERGPELKNGLAVELLSDDDAVIAEGKVDFIAPRATDATQSLTVIAPITSGSEKLRQSQFTQARIVWSTRPSPVVPASAVMRLNGQPFIFVAESDSKNIVAHQRSVELGELSGDVYEVVSGAKVGERVVVSGIQKLHDGATVMPEAPEPTVPATATGKP